jgi:carbamoyl-phosphate synthase small subunit
MKYKKKDRAVLLLEDGTFFEGSAAGLTGTTTGEICFNTGMTGYQEIFTDPSYFGQILITTTAHIGNYGTHRNENESASTKIAGLVCKKFSETYSRPDSNQSLNEYLVHHQLVAISDIDTRMLVRHIRDKGAMNAIISSETFDVEVLKERLASVPSMEGLELSSKVSTSTAYQHGEEDAEHRVAVLDVGVKRNILNCLVERNCLVKVFPMDTSFEELKAWNPDAFMITNGPGDPSAMKRQIDLVGEIIAANYPVFGICLGHQILSLANGLSTYKMHNGHRGINHPIKNLITGKCEVTSQNHGFVVSLEDAERNENIEVTHIHLNDNTLAGMRMKDKLVFSVQYHPEASPGPHDARYLFDQFIENIVKSKALITS